VLNQIRSLHKTSLILSACERQQRPVLYYALDVSIGELTESLTSLMKRMGPTQFVKVRGLLGTYDDCVAWLASDPKMVIQSSVTFLWMGNSIANLQPDDASLLLSRFSHICTKQGVRCQFIVAADACTHKTTIMAAYDTTKRPLHDFLLNGLRHANTVMGHNVFQTSDWTCAVEFNDRANVLNTYYIPRRDLQLDINGIAVEFRKGDQVLAITSGKWTEKDFHAVSVNAGLHIADTWRDMSRIYCKNVPNPASR
jgi:EasF-like predicted methyltransferase